MHQGDFFMRRLFVLLPVIIFSGCASLIGSTSQPVAVTTVCEGRITSGSTCTLSNDKGQWSMTAPGQVQIHKSYENLQIACQNQTSSGTATFISKNNGGAWGNFIFGGVIGYAVDAGGGAGFDYPPAVTIVLNPPCPQGDNK